MALPSCPKCIGGRTILDSRDSDRRVFACTGCGHQWREARTAANRGQIA